MSALVYGQMARLSAARRQRVQIFDDTGKPTTPAKQTTQEKLASSVAGIIPADVLTVHALALQVLTKTDDKGVTTITDMTSMHYLLPILLVVTAILFLLGRGISGWDRIDWAKFAIPLIAIVAWTALVGTSAITPWLTDLKIPQQVAVVLAGAVGVVLVAANGKLADKG